MLLSELNYLARSSGLKHYPTGNIEPEDDWIPRIRKVHRAHDPLMRLASKNAPRREVEDER